MRYLPFLASLIGTAFTLFLWLATRELSSLWAFGFCCGCIVGTLVTLGYKEL